jgi:hypothetical protein
MNNFLRGVYGKNQGARFGFLWLGSAEKNILKGRDSPSIFLQLDLWIIFSSFDDKTASQLHPEIASRLPKYLV